MNRNAAVEARTRVTKRALDMGQCYRPTFTFPNARTALLATLNALHLSPGDKIILPSYIGWSKNEGSGVLDPITSLNLEPVFYHLTRDLQIDVCDLESKMDGSGARVLLLIHYFGFPDLRMAEVVRSARARGLFVIEDEAHAYLSDWVGGVCGRDGDAAIVSLHKILPVDSGGLLVLNSSRDTPLNQVIEGSLLRSTLEYRVLDYDLHTIAERRRSNAEHLLRLLLPLQGRVEPLYKVIPEGVIPQSLPTLVSSRIRDDLYHNMNEAGFGVVSLYHTLISAVDKELFADSHWVSRRIFNLPVHQDATLQILDELAKQLDQQTRGNYIDV